MDLGTDPDRAPDGTLLALPPDPGRLPSGAAFDGPPATAAGGADDGAVLAEGWRQLRLPGQPPTPAELAAFALAEGVPATAVERLEAAWPGAVWVHAPAGLSYAVAARTLLPRGRLLIELTPDGRRVAVTGEAGKSLAELHAERGPSGSPLVPLLRAYAECPVEVRPETRKDQRILPRIQVSESAERTQGRLYGGLLDNRKATDLPLFPEFARAEQQVPILDLVDLSGVPVMARGRGAPLSARLFVRALVTVRPVDRKRPSTRIVLTLKELRDALYPNGWRVGQHWPALRHALLHARDYTLPSTLVLEDGTVSRGRWLPLAVRQLPNDPALHELVVLDIAFPPGAEAGPTVDLPEMDALSVKSAPRWRAYIAARTRSWIPGVTQRPVAGARGRWGWSRNPKDYPVVTREERRLLAFGSQDRMHRTRAQIDAAWQDLPGMTLFAEEAVDLRSGEVGWRLVPHEALDQIDQNTDS